MMKQVDYEKLNKEGLLIVLPCKIGEEVYVSPNNGKDFYKATLRGLHFNNEGKMAYVVDVIRFNGNTFMDYFTKVYTKEEYESINEI